MEMFRRMTDGYSIVRELFCKRCPGTFFCLRCAGTQQLLSNTTLSLVDLEVTDAKSIDALAKHLADTQLDILINNAGVLGAEDQSLNALDPQEWLKTFAVNTVAPLMVSRAVLKCMKNSANPRIMTISSDMGALHDEGMGMYAYRSSKAAVNKVMQVLALELKEKGITVCVVHPGWVKMDMGGEAADLTVEQSASGLVDLARNLTLKQSGTFLTWQGEVNRC